MWQCASCEYWNEELDEACAKCGTERISRDQPDEVADSKAPAATTVDQPESGKRRFGPTEWVAVVIIVVCLGVLGYLAYTFLGRDGIDIKVQLPEVKLPAIDQTGGSDEFNPRKVAEETNHPLAAIYQADQRAVRDYIPYADKLIATEYAIQTVDRPQQAEGGLDRAPLDQLKTLADSLLDSYLEFEADCSRNQSEELVSFQQLIRSYFNLRFEDLVTAIGEFYVVDETGVHPAYLLSDEIPAAVETSNPDLAVLITQHWASVVFDRTQRELDDVMADEIAELESWVEAMTLLHRGFQIRQTEIPPYEVRNGIIDGNAKQALDLLDEMMVDVESLVAGFEEYRVTIGDLGRSNRIKNICRQFDDLAKTDHAYGFEEIYKIYVQDRSLSYPVYDRLRQHYDFVKETWPDLQVAYRVVYSKYESEWTDRWVD